MSQVTAPPLQPCEVEATWPLTGVSIGDALPSHPTRRVFRVDSDQGPYVAKMDPEPRLGRAGSDQIHVLDYLSGKGFAHSPALVRTRTGDPFAPIQGGTCCILEWIPRAVVDGTTKARTWGQLGEAAGRLNTYPEYPVPVRPPDSADAGRARTTGPGASLRIPIRELLERAGRLERLPSTALVHGEINDANSRRRTDGTVVLVDWDQAGTAPPAMEYGYPLIGVFLSEGDLFFDDRSASEFYAGYAAKGGIVERANLFDAALFHALRYMWWADTEQRWDRILYAVSQEAELCSVLAQG